MLNDAIKLLSSGLVSTGLWIAAFLSFVGAFSLITLIDNELFPETSTVAWVILAFAVFLGVVGVFVTSWKLTRVLAQATADERGFMGSWLGWGLVAITPSSILLLVFEARIETSAFWWLESIAVSVAACLTVPIVVHATGRAINDNGPSLGLICDYWLGRYGRLFFAYFLATVPLTLVSDGLYEFGNVTNAVAITSDFVSTVISFASAMLTIAITVVAYREAETARSAPAS